MSSQSAERPTKRVRLPEWHYEKCPCHDEKPSVATTKHCGRCEKYLWTVCPSHEEPPSIKTRESCEMCRDHYWTPGQCSRHERAPSKATTTSCYLCSYYLCSTCWRNEACHTGYGRACTECKRDAKRKEKSKKQGGLAGTKLCANCKGKQLHGASVGEDETEHNTCSCDPNDRPLPERRAAESSVPESISYDRQFLQGVLRQLLCAPYTDREGENLAHWKTGIDMLRAVFPALQSFAADQPHDIGEKPASLDSASNLSRNHWVSTSAQELGTFLKQGRALNAHTSTLRISNTFECFQDAEAAFPRFAQHREVSLMYQNWEIFWR